MILMLPSIYGHEIGDGLMSNIKSPVIFLGY